MKKIVLVGFVISCLWSGIAQGAGAADSNSLPADTYYRARIVAILEAGQVTIDGAPQYHQKIQAEILHGAEKGKNIVIDHGGSFTIREEQKVEPNDLVVITKTIRADGQPLYYIIDQYRAYGLILAAIIFFALAIIFGRKRGLTAIIGLLLSVIAIFYIMIPQIARGGNPLMISLLGALVILFFSLYLSHGFNRRTTIALMSSLIALGIAIIIDFFFVQLTHLTGTGAEEAMYLQIDNGNLDLRSLLLGGIIIGVLGILDDVTTGQAAAVEELHHANETLPFGELYRRGISIGREHIASLINTLVLVYVGASFPLLLLFTTQKNLPLWVILNENFLAEEIVRTLVGSSVLVLAVPITTLIAAYSYAKKAV